MNVLVSVLLLTYNHKNYIKQAVHSVLSQDTSFSFEILIGDDCSTDGTTDILKEIFLLHPDKIKLIQDNQNVGALRNEKRLFDAAIGKYIAFLEGDDYWTDHLKLQKQVDFLEANPDYGMAHGDVDHYFENSGKIMRHVNKTAGTIVPEGYIFNDLMKPNPFFIKTATVCFRKELLTNFFDYNLAIKDNWPLTDFPLWLDISYHSKVHYFNEVFATYRLLNESASRIVSPEKKYNYHLALYKIKQHYAGKYNCNTNVKTALEEVHYRGLLKIAFNMNSKVVSQTAVNYLKQNRLKISFNEQLLVLATRHKFIKRIVNLFRNKK